MTEQDPARGRRALAEENFRAGYSCAQSVLLAFSDRLPISRGEAARLASPFGAGIGRLRETCGAVTGMLMAAGFLLGYSDPDAAEEKAALYALTQKLVGAFLEKHGTMVCRDLLADVEHTDGAVPEARDDAYYARRPCMRLVGDAAEILEEELRART